MNDVRQTKILIAFYSRSGVTEQLAIAIADGARSAGSAVTMRRAREFVAPEVMQAVPGWEASAKAMNERYDAPSAADAEWADGIIFGSPTRFGNMAAELKAYVDSLGGLWAQGKLNGKAGSAFASTSTRHGGNETTIVSMYFPMVHLGFIIVPPGYADPAMLAGGTPYGATSVSGSASADPTEADLAAARYQGKRVALVAEALKNINGAE